MSRFKWGNYDTPCKDCTERHLKCHADCEKYKEWKAKVDDLSDKRKKFYEPYMYYYDKINENEARLCKSSFGYSKKKFKRSQ